MNLAQLMQEADDALEALAEAADGDSNDAEIEAGNDVADALTALLNYLRNSED